MTMELVATIGKDTLFCVLKVAGPLLLTGLVVGVAVTMFQSVTQLKDMTLTFVPKIVGVGLALLLSLPFMLRTLISFTTHLFLKMGELATL